MSWFEFTHLLRDIRYGRGWHDYPYAKPGQLLYLPEKALRKLWCVARGHRQALPGSWIAETYAGTLCLRCFDWKPADERRV